MLGESKGYILSLQTLRNSATATARGADQDHMDRVIAVPYVVSANVAKSPWASGAVRKPGLLGVRGDQLFHQAAVLSEFTG